MTKTNNDLDNLLFFMYSRKQLKT